MASPAPAPPLTPERRTSRDRHELYRSLRANNDALDSVLAERVFKLSEQRLHNAHAAAEVTQVQHWLHSHPKASAAALLLADDASLMNLAVSLAKQSGQAKAAKGGLALLRASLQRRREAEAQTA